MSRRRIIVFLVLLTLQMSFSMNPTRAAEPTSRPVQIQKTSYKGWDNAWRMSNGTVEAVVVPSIGGRIMHYGYVGGRNEIWENPDLAGKTEPPSTDWQNFGGDKIWPWPQDEWPQRIDRAWPPVYAMDLLPFDAQVRDDGTLRLTSQVVPEYNVRVQRDIRLAPKGTKLTVTSDFIPVEGQTPVPASAWEVTQVPFPQIMLVRLLPGKSPDTGTELMIKDAPWRSTREIAPGIVELVSPGTVPGKIGIDGDLLAGLRGDTLLTQRLVPVEGEFEPNERLQVYAVKDEEPNPNVEFEFTAPRTPEPDGTSRPLTVVWELTRVPADQRTPAALAELLRQVAPVP